MSEDDIPFVVEQDGGVEETAAVASERDPPIILGRMGIIYGTK